GIFQPKSGDQVVIGVGQYRKALLDERASRAEQPLGIGEQGLPITNDLELDELVESGLPGQPGVTHRLVGRVAAGSVGQEEVFLAGEVVQHPFFFGSVEVYPADRYRDDLGAGRFDGPGHDPVVPVLAGAHHQTRTERASAYGEWKVGSGRGGDRAGQPRMPQMTSTISTPAGTDLPLTIGGRAFRSRLMVGTGKYRDNRVMAQAIEASGAEIVTVAVRRVDLDR